MTAEAERDRWIAIGEKIAALKVALLHAKLDLEQLDYPLFVRLSDEPRRERRATAEEVTKWKADAAAKVAEIEKQIEELRNGD